MTTSAAVFQRKLKDTRIQMKSFALSISRRLFSKGECLKLEPVTEI